MIPHPKSHVILSERSESKDLRLLFAVLKGHDFSRAVNEAKLNWALAPEVCFSDFILKISAE
jgi:hypothetical protein